MLGSVLMDKTSKALKRRFESAKSLRKARAWKVINVYTDKARTGTNDARPGFQRMIADAKSGAFRYIIVYMFDRFARNRHDSIVYKETIRYGREQERNSRSIERKGFTV